MAEKNINGRTFKTEPLLATQAIILQARLLKLVGPALNKLGDVLGARSTGDAAKSDMAAMAAIADIFAQATPEELAGLVKDVVEVAMIKRPSGSYERIDFDGDFTGHQKDLIPVVTFVLREQFSDFFTALPGSGNLGIAAKG